jgi:hypothetical protein
MSSKTCRKCGETKPITDFCTVKRNKDGLNIYCRDCVYERYAKKRDIPDNTGAIISKSILNLINSAGAVYTDDLIKDTGLTRERITMYLKANGFVKTSGHMSRRWAIEKVFDNRHGLDCEG